jgi:hypothetical protein
MVTSGCEVMVALFRWVNSLKVIKCVCKRKVELEMETGRWMRPVAKIEWRE